MTSALSFYLGRRGVSRSGGNCISAAAASSNSHRHGRIITAAAVVLMGAAAAVSFFGCHPVGAHRTHGTNGTDGTNARIDFVTPNPDVAETAAALKTALNL